MSGVLAPHRIVVLCFAVGILEGFDIQVIGIAAPLIAKAFTLPPTDLSWLFFVSNFGILIGATAGGALADHFGRRPVLIAASTIFGAFTLAVAVWVGFAPLLAFRALAGLGLGAALPNLVATAADITQPERRGFATGLIFCGVPLGGATVALLSQALPPALDWRTLFAVGGALPLIVALLQYWWLPETRPAAFPTIRQTNALQILFGEGRALTTLLLWAVIAPTLMALYLVLYWLPTLIVSKGLPMGVAAHASAAFNLAGAAGAVGVGLLSDRLPRAYLLGGCYIVFVCLVLLLAPATSSVPIVALSAFAGFLLLGTNYAAYGLAPLLYPPAARGTGSGAAVGVGRIGSIIGPVAPGLLLANGMAARDIIWLLAPVAALTAACVFILNSFIARIALERPNNSCSAE